MPHKYCRAPAKIKLKMKLPAMMAFTESAKLSPIYLTYSVSILTYFTIVATSILDLVSDAMAVLPSSATNTSGCRIVKTMLSSDFSYWEISSG